MTRPTSDRNSRLDAEIRRAVTELVDLAPAPPPLGEGIYPKTAGRRSLIGPARRARRRTLIIGIGGVAVLALVGALLVPALVDRGGDRVNVAAGEAKGDFAPGWTRLADPPLSSRTGAATAFAGNDVVVAGGSRYLCPPGPGCTPPPPSGDGAAFNLTSRKWRPIAPSPIPFAEPEIAVVGDDIFLLVLCLQGACDAGQAVLRYRPTADTWDVLPAPPERANYTLTRLGGELVAYAGGKRRPHAGGPYWLLNVTSRSWVRLPDDPMRVVMDADVVSHGDDLLVFGAEIGGQGGASRYLGARLDGATRVWSELPPGPGAQNPGFQALDGVVSGQIAGAGGGIFDLGSRTWKPLPAQPPTTNGRSDLAGVLRDTGAVYGAAAGLVFDVTTSTWIEVPQLDAAERAPSLTSIGRRLFLFGGDRWPSTPGGDLISNAWVWTPPPPQAEVPPPSTALKP